MFNVGGGEVLVILLIALIVLGPDKLPNAARQAGKYLGDFRRMSSGFQRELRDASDHGDLGDLMSATTNPTPPGGPTPQPTPTPAAAPATDSTPPTTTAPAAATNGSAPDGVTGNGSGPAASVRKRSIEVDGPSTSFD
jgi:sec-independent protein translocase protein TatB